MNKSQAEGCVVIKKKKDNALQKAMQSRTDSNSIVSAFFLSPPWY